MAARATGVKVIEFALGMGPVLFKKQKGETIYSLRIFPLGGFCQMEGEDDEVQSENSFGAKSVWARILIVVMGSVMNLLFGLILIAIIIGSTGYVTTTTVDEFKEGSTPVADAGLMIGDQILKLDDTKVNIADDILYFLTRSGGENVDVTIMRDGKTMVLYGVDFPYKDINREEISGDARDKDKTYRYYYTDFYVQTQDINPINLIRNSFYKSISIVKMVALSLADLIRGKIPVTDLSGPVGVAGAIGEAAKTSVLDLLNLLALISINLGVVNLFPLPALDGGRLVFLLIEASTKRKVPAKYEGYVHYAGIFLLMVLMVFLVYNDIFKLVA